MKRMRPLLGTFVEVAIADSGDLTDLQSQEAINSAFLNVEKIQQLLSFHQPDSDLSRLNCSAMQWVELHPLSIYCLKLARATMRITKGKFNCTLGKALVDKNRLPAPAVNASINIGDWKDIEICGNRARLIRPIWVVLDGIAKGFAVDLAIKTLQQHGAKSALVNAGGDMRVYGPEIFPVSICDHKGQYHTVGGLQNAAIATSTSEYTDNCPGVLLDTNAEEIKASSWTVIANRAWRADALTKVAANLLGHERREYIRRLGGNWISLDATFS